MNKKNDSSNYLEGKENRYGTIKLTPGFDLTGEVAIVTGGNGGIGRGIAIGLAQAGSGIIIAARNEEKTARVVDEIRDLGRRCVGIRCDVNVYEEIRHVVEKTVQEFGNLECLILLQVNVSL